MQAFILRMADHGHSVSRTFMIFDRHYALEQMQHAHALADEELRQLAMALFRHSESRLAAMQGGSSVQVSRRGGALASSL